MLGESHEPRRCCRRPFRLSCARGWFVQHGVVPLLGFPWRYISDCLQKSSLVELVRPFQVGKFHRFEVPPWYAPMNGLGLVDAVDRFGGAIVVTVGDTSDRRLDTCFCQTLGIANGHVLGRFNWSPQHLRSY